MFRTKSKDELIANAISQMMSESSITQMAPGSKARAIIEALGTVIGDVSSDLALGTLSTFLPNASGPTLDLVADTFGIQRLSEIPATIVASDQNLKYYVRTGTFGNINGGAAITIPAGTEIKIGGSSGQTDALFIQKDSITLPSSASEYYFSADQLGKVLSRGVGPSSLTRHNFTGYLDSPFQSLLVTNTKGVAGRSRESDNNLRFRITQALTSNATANLVAIRLAALSVPGVSDIKISEFRSGMGTFDVIVYGISPIVSSSLLQLVQNQIDRYQAAGTRGIAVQPRLVGVSLKIRLTFADKAIASDKNSASQLVKNAIREYILNLEAEQEFIINDLVGLILTAHPLITDVGSPNKPIDEIFLWKPSYDGINRFSRKLISNYLIKDDEELVVEPFLSTPIEVLEA